MMSNLAKQSLPKKLWNSFLNNLFIDAIDDKVVVTLSANCLVDCLGFSDILIEP
ncbi:MAG: hypothetical protein WBV73_25405 [Phormidium sp.]